MRSLLPFLPIALLAVFALSGCRTGRASPEMLSAPAAAELNLADMITKALARGEKVLKSPRGDYTWLWAQPGEPLDFERWHYEIIPK